VSEPTASFTVELKDETSGSAEAAAKALTNLKKKIDEDVKALRDMQAALRNLKGSQSASAAQINALTERISAQKSKIAAAQSKYLQLGGTFGATETKSKSLSERLKALGGALGDSGGSVSVLGSGLARLAPLLANPVVLVGALVAALVAFVGATALAVAALARYSLAQADARRSELLRLEGFTTMRTMFGRVIASAGEMQTAIDHASDAWGVGRDQLEGYARGLARIGFHGQALTSTLEGMALALQVQGERGAMRFRNLAVMAARSGRSVEDVAEAYRRRLGPIANRIMMSLPNQANRLRMSLERIFSGVRIENFLSALNQITSAFSQQTATGRALKTIVESLFNPIFDATGTLGPVLRRFFQGMVIGALLLTIALLKVRNGWRRIFGDSDLLGNMDMLTVALYAGVGAVLLFAFALGVAVAVLAMIALSVAAFVAMLLAVPAIAMAAGAAIVVGLRAVYEWFEATDFVGLGESMINGLVTGILRGTTAIRNAVTSIANTARNTFRNALGISSPSRVFASLGLNIAQGLTRGVDRGQTMVNESVGSLVDVPTGGAARGGNSSVSIGDVIIQGVNTDNPRELALAVRDELASILEGVSIELGAT
jgi:hypothetical protein